MGDFSICSSLCPHLILHFLISPFGPAPAVFLLAREGTISGLLGHHSWSVSLLSWTLLPSCLPLHGDTAPDPPCLQCVSSREMETSLAQCAHTKSFSSRCTTCLWSLCSHCLVMASFLSGLRCLVELTSLAFPSGTPSNFHHSNIFSSLLILH